MKNTSPSSSRTRGSSWRCGALRQARAALRTSLSSTPYTFGQSKPTRAAFSCIRWPRCSAPRCFGIPSSRLVRRAAGLLKRLEPLPVAPLRVDVFDDGVAEDVRMTPDHLVGERVDDVGDAELADLGRELRVEEHLQQQVAELFAESLEMRDLDRLDDFERLFDEVRNERAVRLLAVPRAAEPQPRHDLDQVVPGVVRGLRRKRHERHRDRGRERRARHAGHDLGRDRRALRARASSGGKSGKIRERVSEHAEPERPSRQRRVVESAATKRAISSRCRARRARDRRPYRARLRRRCARDRTVRSGGASSSDRSSDRPQRVEAADRQESWIARTRDPRCEPAR